MLVYHYLNTTFSFCECIVSALSECPHYANRLMCLRYCYGWQISEEYMYIIYFNAVPLGNSGPLRVHFPPSTFHTCMACYSHFVSVQFLLFFFCSCYTISSFAFCAVIRVEWREYFFENLDHNFTNLFLQIYKIMLWCHLKSIKSVDTKMSSEEYRESYATMY